MKKKALNFDQAVAKISVLTPLQQELVKGGADDFIITDVVDGN